MDIPKTELFAVLQEFNPWWSGQPIGDLTAWERSAAAQVWQWVLGNNVTGRSKTRPVSFRDKAFDGRNDFKQRAWKYRTAEEVAAMPIPAKDLTPEQVIEALKSGDLRAKVRLVLTQYHGKVEQDAQQRKPGGPIEWRRMELHAAEDIIALIAGEPIGYVFELARARTDEGEWRNWGPPQFSFMTPNVPPGSIRNLHPVYELPK